MSKEQLQTLCQQGWGVSCHSMTHALINEENAHYEVVESRTVLEQALGLPVKMFCVPGSNDSYEPVRNLAEQAGYNSIMTIYDNINTVETSLYKLNRCPLHSEYPPPFNSVFDAYKRIHQAIEHSGWIIDYCHCPTPGKAIHPWKDCTTEELEERFSKVTEIGEDDVWLAEPNEVVEYLIGRSA